MASPTRHPFMILKQKFETGRRLTCARRHSGDTAACEASLLSEAKSAALLQGRPLVSFYQPAKPVFIAWSRDKTLRNKCSSRRPSRPRTELISSKPATKKTRSCRRELAYASGESHRTQLLERLRSTSARLAGDNQRARSWFAER